MSRRRALLGVVVLCGLAGSALLSGAGSAAPDDPDGREAERRERRGLANALALGLDEPSARTLLTLSPLPPPPPDPTNRVAGDPVAARLGRALFEDPALSADGSVSCRSCHDPDRGWGDGRALAEGQAATERHAMTLWNVAYQRWFFWDGRADSLWSQALQPFEDPREHGSSRLAVAHRVAAVPGLRRDYEALFGELPDLADGQRFPAEGRPVPDDPEHPHARAWGAMASADQVAIDHLFANVGKAIAAFEGGLVSRQSRFDRFVEGLRTGAAALLAALDERERRGLALFVGEARCSLCHAGPLFSDREFHDTRLPALPGRRRDRGRIDGIAAVLADPFNGTGPHSDDPEDAAETLDYLAAFGHNVAELKTPSLRNVAVTAPYMHDGRFATLRDVLHFYNTLEGAARPAHGGERLLVPLGLSDQQLDDLEAFLRTLTDTSALERLAAPRG